MKEHLFNIRRAPSQFKIFTHLLVTGKALTPKELQERLNLTYKAVERAVDKLLRKGLIQRARFREGAYCCNARRLLMYVLLACLDFHTQLQEGKKAARSVKG